MRRRLLFPALMLLLFACDDGGSDPTLIGDAATGGADGAAGQDGGVGGIDGADGAAGADGAGGGDGTGGGGGADGGGAPDCPLSTDYGLLAPPGAIGAADTLQHTPRAVWSGSEWGVVWMQGSPGALGRVLFQRLNAEGEAIGAAPTEIGQAKLPKYDVMYNGAGYVVVWLSARGAAGGVEGIMAQPLGPTGEPLGGPSELGGTFDVDRVASAWATGTGGMIVYTKGRLGVDGLFATPLDEGGQPGATVTLFPTWAKSPSVTFGNGNWGVAWLDPAGEFPEQIVFQLVNDAGQPQGAPLRPPGGNGLGEVHLAFGESYFGIAWSALNPMGQLKPQLTLLNDGGEFQANVPLVGPEGYGLVTDISWLNPNFFGIAWQDNRSGQPVRVGLTRVNGSTLGLGQVLEPYGIPSVDIAGASGLAVAGTNTNAGAFYTFDPDPQPTGLSDGTRVRLGRLGTCRQ